MIYIATHKSFSFNKEKDYCPIQVGAEGNNDLFYLKDNTGDNISNKNKNFCELTGVYWIWKNTSDDIKGLVHYRRYFSDSIFMKKISIEHVERILNKYDVILPFKRRISGNVIKNYEECGYARDLYLTREIILEKYPEYIEYFDEFMKDDKIRLFNMIIAKGNIFDEYSKWLFDILFELEKRVDLTGYDNYQQRIFGFISERLLNVYFLKNKYKIFECGVIPTETKWSFMKRIKTGMKRKMYSIYQMYL